MRKKVLPIFMTVALAITLWSGFIVHAAQYDSSKQYDADKEELASDPGFVPFTNENIVYTGTWESRDTSKTQHTNPDVEKQLIEQTNGSAANGFKLCAWGDNSCSAKFTFVGTSIKLIMVKATAGSFCSVKLDDVTQDGEEEAPNGLLFNTNTSGDTFCNWVTFEKTGLTEGTHTIEVQNVDGGWGTAQLKLVGFVTDPQKEEDTAKAEENSSNPKTGDASMVFVVVAGVASVTTAGFMLRTRKKD